MTLRLGEVVVRTVALDEAEWNAISADFDLYEATRATMGDIHIAMITSLERDKVRVWDSLARRFGYKDYRDFCNRNFDSKLSVDTKHKSVHLVNCKDILSDTPSNE